jgi:hypothetical protein
MVCGWVVVVLHGAGQGCHRVGDIMPCRCAWNVGLEEVLVHGNAGARSARSGSSITSDRLGRGGVLSGARPSLVWEIDPLGQGGSGGEVTDRGAVGGVLAKRRCPQWPGRRLGGVGCLGRVTARWGQGLGASRVALIYWGSMAASG